MKAPSGAILGGVMYSPVSEEISKFVWRDRYGTCTRLKDMGSTHMVSTATSLWNHFAQDALKVAPFKGQKFSAKIYSREYLKEALSKVLAIVSEREDLSATHHKAAQYMVENYDKLFEEEFV